MSQQIYPTAAADHSLKNDVEKYKQRLPQISSHQLPIHKFKLLSTDTLMVTCISKFLRQVDQQWTKSNKHLKSSGNVSAWTGMYKMTDPYVLSNTQWLL